MWHSRESETDEFLALVVRSGLATEASLREVCAEFAAESADESADESELDKLCMQLVAMEILTQWQCEKLRAGKHRGFFLDNYKLMGQVGLEKVSTIYLAVDIDSGKEIVLRNTPPQRGKSFQYEVLGRESG